MKEMSAYPAHEKKMENIRQGRSRFLLRNGNIQQSAWRYHQGGPPFSSESTPYRKENVNSRFSGNGFVINKIHNNRGCKVGARLSSFLKKPRLKLPTIVGSWRQLSGGWRLNLSKFLNKFLRLVKLPCLTKVLRFAIRRLVVY